jgi:lysophospholipid acyltransferase (LPLAT)-like uncharacterized protein
MKDETDGSFSSFILVRMPGMKLRHPWLIRAVGFGAAWAVCLWIGTLRYRYRPRGPNLDPTRPGFGGRYIYAFWHENLLLPAYQYRRTRVHVLISQHADGQLIAEACRHLGFRTVRGSTARHGITALREMVQAAEQGHLAITPDGPRGPRRRVQLGLIYLAARTALPIVPTGFAYDRPWRARSWDRFALPRPWSLGTCVTGEPIRVPPEADRKDLERYRQLVEEALLQVTDAADSLAGQGHTV